jgi:outer membrane beta-barrel protein
MECRILRHYKVFLPLVFLLALTALLDVQPTLAAAPSDLEAKYGPRPVDGIYVEAVQNYIAPKRNEIGLDFGVWPLQPYYNGFSIAGSYIYHFNKDSAWEVANVSYLYTVDTDLTRELAADNQRTPQVIERVNYIASSNYVWNIAYGKFAFFENNIRYFRSGLLLGPALIVTNQKSYVGPCFGWTIESFVSEKTSWKFQIRDNYAFGADHPHNLSFLFGTTYGF